MLVVLVLGVRAERHDHHRFALGAASLIALVFAYLIFSYVGTRFGPATATQSRYCYYGILLSSPAVAILLDRVGRRQRDRMSLPAAWWFLALGLSAAVGLSYTFAWTHQIREAVGNLPEVAVTGSRIERAGDPLLSDRVEPRVNPDLTLSSLGSRAVETLPDVEPSRASELDARANLQVSVSAEQTEPTAPAGARGPGTSGSVCSTLSAGSAGRVSIPVPVSGVVAEVRPAADAVIETRISLGDDHSNARSWRIHGPQSEFLRSTASGFVLGLVVVEGRVELCWPR